MKGKCTESEGKIILLFKVFDRNFCAQYKRKMLAREGLEKCSVIQFSSNSIFRPSLYFSRNKSVYMIVLGAEAKLKRVNNAQDARLPYSD